MAPLQRDGHEQAFEEDDPLLPWVHAFCLELEVLRLLPQVFAPLLAPLASRTFATEPPASRHLPTKRAAGVHW